MSQNQAFINTSELMFAAKGGKVPAPGQMPLPKSETPKNNGGGPAEEEAGPSSGQREI